MLQKNLSKFGMLLLIISQNYFKNTIHKVISKLVKIQTDSKYSIGINFDEAIGPLVLRMPKTSGYVKTSKVKEEDKDENNNLMSSRTDDEKLLQNYKYKAI